MLAVSIGALPRPIIGNQAHASERGKRAKARRPWWLCKYLNRIPPMSEGRSGSSCPTPRHAVSFSPPMFFTANSTFCLSRRMPGTTSSEMFVALRSSRTRTIVPSRISRTTPSPAKSRPFQAS